MRYLLEELPRRTDKPVHFDILCGTSVGAIHACYLAATAHESTGRGQRLVDFWRAMQIEQVLPFSRRELVGLLRRALGLRGRRSRFRSGEVPERIYGMLDTRNLERMVVSAVPWRRIRGNVRAGRLSAVCVAATEIATGRVVCFMESAERDLPGWAPDPSIVPQITHLRPTHALASAAIPLLFPAVRIEHTFYADGGLRLNTPLAPALRLGADKVLVVALRPHGRTAHAATLARHRLEDFESPSYLFGKVLNSLLLDHLDSDLARMRVMNDMLRDGEQAFGPDFIDSLNRAGRSQRAHPLRWIDDLVIRPSADLGVMAGEVLQQIPHLSLRSPLLPAGHAQPELRPALGRVGPVLLPPLRRRVPRSAHRARLPRRRRPGRGAGALLRGLSRCGGSSSRASGS